jgi:uncharacterized protein (DUF2342 family)
VAQHEHGAAAASTRYTSALHSSAVADTRAPTLDRRTCRKRVSAASSVPSTRERGGGAAVAGRPLPGVQLGHQLGQALGG